MYCDCQLKLIGESPTSERRYRCRLCNQEMSLQQVIDEQSRQIEKLGKELESACHDLYFSGR